MKQLQDRRVLILGLGVSGLAMAKWCVRCGAEVTVADTRDEPPGLARLTRELPDVRFRSGAFDASLIEGSGLQAVFASPGLSPATLAPVLRPAAAQGLWCGGELSLFSQALADLRALDGYAPTLLAVTGTNGKTTVTMLTSRLVEAAGKDVATAGNIGPSLLDTLTARLEAGALPEVWVLELSSFQLEFGAAFEPAAAVVLNISQDHLDWHGSMQAYAATKARIFGKHGLMVLNRDDSQVMQMAALPATGKAKNRSPARARTSFGADLPQRPGDFGIEVVNGMAWLVRAASDAQTAEKTHSRQRRAAGGDALFIQRLMPVEALRIRGRHNALNALAALALAAAAGCSLAPMLAAIRDYPGEPHRLEPVGVIDGVEYFDDSKGTNVGATVAALEGLGIERRLLVILGGDGKGQDFTPLAGPVSRFARAVVLIGRDAPSIRNALAHTGVSISEAASMEQAVAVACRQAQSGDAVLMSPACASLDMYRNYEHRAQAFRDAVSSLARERGLSLEAAA